MKPTAPLRFASWLLCPAAVLCLISPIRAEEKVVLALEDVREARDIFLEEERAAEGCAWLWGTAAVGCGAWSVYSPVRHGAIGAPEIAAAVGAIGLAGASLKSAERRAAFARPRSLLSTAMESAGPEGVSLGWADALEVEGGLEELGKAFSAAATGGMRTGCVVPALLCGVAVFGYSLGDASGRDLAGACLLSALVIGGPAVINSLNINHKLHSMDLLISRWRESVKQ